MKNLILSILCLMILMIPWGIYRDYSDTAIGRYTDMLMTRVIPAAESGEWQQAESYFDSIEKDWNRFRRVSAYFADTYSLNDITAHICRVSCYIRQKDTVNTIVEATDLHHELLCLHENGETNSGNLF